MISGIKLGKKIIEGERQSAIIDSSFVTRAFRVAAAGKREPPGAGNEWHARRQRRALTTTRRRKASSIKDLAMKYPASCPSSSCQAAGNAALPHTVSTLYWKRTECKSIKLESITIFTKRTLSYISTPDCWMQLIWLNRALRHWFKPHFPVRHRVAK